MAKDTTGTDIRVAVIEENPVEREYLLALVGGAPGMAVHGGITLEIALSGPATEQEANAILRHQLAQLIVAQRWPGRATRSVELSFCGPRVSGYK